MHPTTTIYRLADCATDYTACHRILRLHGRPDDWTLHFPTVVAIRSGKVIGFLSTVKCSWCLMAGPLEFLAPQGNGITMIRLGEAYEVVLRTMGVTRYCIAVEAKPENAFWIQQVNRAGYNFMHETATHAYFERILDQPLRLAA